MRRKDCISLLTVRKAKRQDAEQLRELYFHHLTAFPPAEKQDMKKWESMIQSFEENLFYHLLVGEIGHKIVSSVTLVIIPNLTHNCRPYAVIENVVTHCDFRGNHIATTLMAHASEIARQADCYKIMLLTGSKKESTLHFYENCGFDQHIKTAFLKKI